MTFLSEVRINLLTAHTQLKTKHLSRFSKLPVFTVKNPSCCEKAKMTKKTKETKLIQARKAQGFFYWRLVKILCNGFVWHNIGHVSNPKRSINSTDNYFQPLASVFDFCHTATVFAPI